ncbi:MAG: hypothetical protein AAF741_00130 [Bacteroidota bacterium]
MRHFILFILFFAFLPACRETNSVPKPRSFPRVIYPDRNYVDFQTDYCNFTFQHPDYAQVVQKELFFDDAPADPCWFDLEMPAFNGQIHFTYYPVEDFADWEKRRDEGFKLAGYHNVRASYTEEIRIDRDPDFGGMIFDIEGEAASPFQFFVTDSLNHFVRGALYFNTKSRPDSLKPVVEFVKEDIYRMLETFEWQE